MSDRTLRVLAAAALIAAGLGACQRRNASTVVIPDHGPAQYAEALRLAEEAEKAREAGNLDKAIQLYNQSLGSSQEIAIVWHNYGMLLVNKGDKVNAVEMLKRAAELDIDNPSPYYNIGLIYADNGQPEKGLQFFRKAIERDSRHLPSLRGVAKMSRRLQAADEESLEWMKLALLLETDQEWRKLFEEEKLRIDGALQSQGRTGKF